MDIEGFKIYVDRLHDGNVEVIEETFAPAFLEQDREDLAYKKDVRITGEAYTAENELVIHLDVHTEATLPCKICNQPVNVPVELKGLYLVESLEKMKSGIFIFKNLLREAILLEAPSFAECSGGQCPERRTMSAFLADVNDAETPGKEQDDEGYQPFANLEL